MNWLAEGTREFVRKWQRLRWRLKLVLESRHLASAEETLGELGWQQADLPDAMKPALADLNNAEKQQALFLNRSAEIAHRAGELQNERTRNRQSLKEALDPVDAERAPLVEKRDELLGRLKAHENNLPVIEKHLDRLVLEADTLKKLNEDLLVSNPAPADFILQRGKLADYRAGVSTDRDETERNQRYAKNEIRAMKKELFEVEDKLAVVVKRASAIKREFDAGEKRLVGEIRSCDQEKAEVAVAIDSLDADKSAPLRLIGQCLADSGIGSRNQPGALKAVRKYRKITQTLRQQIADSWQATNTREDPGSFVLTMLLLAVVLASAGFCIWLAISR